jgi:hypothetical protein
VYLYALKALPTKVDVIQNISQPSDPYLYPSYPNPFNSATTIQYDLPEPMKVNIAIYNLLGQKIKGIENKFQQAGTHTIHWNGSDQQGNPVSSGLYFCQMDSKDFKRSVKLLLLR